MIDKFLGQSPLITIIFSSLIAFIILMQSLTKHKFLIGRFLTSVLLIFLSVLILVFFDDLVDENNNPVYEYEFFIWGPNSLYYEHTPITKFSIGNGISEENRNNLIEITDDGNIHYAKGEKNLFALENVVENI